MAFNGSGTFQRLYNWVTDRTNSIKIRADRMDAEMDGFASGLSNAICKDGQTTLTADLPFNNRKITGLGNATLAADALNQQTGDGRYQKRPSSLVATTTFDDADFAGLYDSITTNDLKISGVDFRSDLLSRLRTTGDIFATGAVVTTIFRQTTAPTGWTKITTLNDAGLRVVSGSIVDGGTTNFSVAWPAVTPSGTIGGSALSVAQLAVHTHGVVVNGNAIGGSGVAAQSDNTGSPFTSASQSAGSGSTHNHTFTGNALAANLPKFVDVIFASKN